MFEQHSDRHLVAAIDALLDQLLDDRLRLDSDPERLQVLADGLRVQARFEAWQRRYTAAIDAYEVAARTHGTSMVTWLADAVTLTPREARRLIRGGVQLSRFPIVADAAASGAVSAAPAEAVTGVLDQLPDSFDAAAVTDGQRLMVEFAATHNSAELRRLTGHLLEVLAPDTAEQLEADRVEAEYRRAHRNRHLEWSYDHAGSVFLRGSLTVVDAEPLLKLVDAYAAEAKRALDGALDPQAIRPSIGQRRADALLTLTEHDQRAALAPCHGGDRPRLVVTLAYDKLLKQATDTGLVDAPPVGVGGRLVDGGQPIPAGVLRRLLCDAGILPVVLGGNSDTLDVGRSQRLVTPPIRAALDQRDQGCVFPGCDQPPAACHAHHIRPWWAGGTTALTNLVLVCPHHHNLVEPSHDPTADRWTVHLHADGQPPHVRPPQRVDPDRRPRAHARFLTRLRT